MQKNLNLNNIDNDILAIAAAGFKSELPDVALVLIKNLIKRENKEKDAARFALLSRASITKSIMDKQVEALLNAR